MDFEPAETSERIVHRAELLIAYLLVLFLLIGIFDLILVAASLVLSGEIADPTTLFELLNVTLLLFVIIEVYQTVMAYTREVEEQQIVRLIIYASIIAIARKIIVFQTSTYQSISDALTAALSYAVLLVGLAAILLITYWGRE